MAAAAILDPLSKLIDPNKMPKPVNKVVIVGCGTAGWLTAGLLAAEHKAQEGFDVVLIQ